MYSPSSMLLMEPGEEREREGREGDLDGERAREGDKRETTENEERGRGERK